jgi:hypothetical protein
MVVNTKTTDANVHARSFVLSLNRRGVVGSVDNFTVTGSGHASPLEINSFGEVVSDYYDDRNVGHGFCVPPTARRSRRSTIRATR